MARRAGIAFIDAFLGSLVTLMLASTFVEVDSDVVPDALFLVEMIVAAMIAGMIAAISVVRDWLATMNGHE